MAVGGPVPVFVCPGAVRVWPGAVLEGLVPVLVCPGAVLEGLVPVLVCPGAVLDGLVVVMAGADMGDASAWAGLVLVRPGADAGVVPSGCCVLERNGLVTVERREGVDSVPTEVCGGCAAGATVAPLATAARSRLGRAGGAASRAPR